MNKKRCLSFASIIALGLLLLFINACGSSANKDGDATSVSTVSNTACVTCHSASIEPLSGDAIVTKYTASVHNLNSVGCQDCHGAGGSHNGIGPIPYPRPNYVQCRSCHDSGTATSYPLVTAYENSKHFGVALEPDAPCNRCHTHQGAVLSTVSHFTGDGTVMAAGIGAPGAITGAEPIKCDTCHVTHQTDKLRVDTAWNPSTTVGSVTSSLASSLNDQFRLCTQCHGYTNPAGLLMGSGTVASGTALVGHHETSWYRIIGTTHFDNPATPNDIEGYVLRTNGPNRANACFDCHGHEANAGTRYGQTTTPTIYTDWAQSGHAGGLLAAKYTEAALHTARTVEQVDAVMAAAIDSPAWAEEGGVGAGSSCARCHTSTGAASYLSGASTYNAATLDFSHRAAGQKEMLYCWGCHSNAGSGTLRTPGAFKTDNGATPILPLTDYAFDAGSGNAAITFPNVNGSNVCVPCHSSRRNRIYLETASKSSSFRLHYLPAAATLFSEQSHIAYEYDIDGDGNFAEHYTPVAYFAHNKIGTADEPGTGSNGPCVACHMSGSSHTFSPVIKTGSTITAIRNQAACDVCHTAEHGLMTAAKLNEESAGMQNAATVLKAYVANTLPNYAGEAITTARTDRRDYGALQNSMYVDAPGDPGAYAHNSVYIKRIIFDSIDWLDNGAFNGTITINATTYPEAALWFGVSAGTATRP